MVSTRWEEIDEGLGVRYEEELTAKAYFRPLADAHVRLLRHNGTVESARNIVSHLIRNDPAALQIQQDLDVGMNLIKTIAVASSLAKYRNDLENAKQK